MPPLPASDTATRFAAHWVADALAGDEALEFSVLKALVGASSESLAGAPEATRERVALRCLEEVAAVVAAGGDAPATAKVLRVDDARSCEDLLLQLIGEVGSSGNLEKDLLLPFSQDIQNIVHIKKPTLPETSFELLREVDPEIMSMTPPSQLEQNGTTQLDNDQSLCRSHDHVNIEKPRFPADNGELQQETLINLVDEIDTRSIEKDLVAPTSVLHQPCTSASMCYNPPQEDAIGAASCGARSPERSPILEGNISVGTLPASASCDATLQGDITEPLSKLVTEDTTMVQPQSHREISPNPLHYIDGERSHDGGSSDLSSKDPRHEELSMHTTVNPDIDRSGDALPTNTSEPEFNTAQEAHMISQPHSSKTHPSALQHGSGEKVNQDLDDVSASIQPVEKDHVHEELTQQAACILPSISCNGAIQGGKSEANHQSGNTTEPTTVFEHQNVDKSHQEVSGANKVNQAQHDGSVQEINVVSGGPNAQTAPMSQACKITLHDKISEASYLSEENSGKNRTDIQKCGCDASVPSSAQDGDGKSASKISNKEIFGDTSVEISVPSDDSLRGTAAAGLLSMIDKMPFFTKDQGINDSLGDLSQQDLCIKCNKDGQLLKCNRCSLTAHDRCFGSSATFEETGLFYCPVCFYTKATEAYQKAKQTYCEARKNLAAFLGTAHLGKQHDEQPTGLLPGASNIEGHSNGCDSSKRKNIHQNEADNLSHQDEEPHRQRKKQKINDTGNGCPEQVVTEKVPFLNSDAAPMNKHTVLKNNCSKRVQGTEKQKQVENEGVCREAGNDYSSHETRSSSQKKRGPPPANQEVEADREAGLANSDQPDDSDELEATSSNDSGKRSSPPWRNMRHSKARLQEKETTASNSRKTNAEQDQHIPSSSRQKNYVYPQKRYSNPVAPSGRRSALCWTEEEEAALKEAMAKFAPQDGAQIPWVYILEYGRDVFHRTRLPSDLRVKWRNMKKKALRLSHI